MKNLNKEINLNKKFIVIMILFTIITIGLYTSYALFEISVIQNNVVVIRTGTIDITTSITGLDTPTFTLATGETKNITVDLTTTQTDDIGYKMYYDVTNGISLFNVTSTTDYTSTNNKVEGELNISKTITFTFQNTGNEDITITLGTQGGLKGYPIPLEQGIELKVNEELGVPVKNAIVTSVNNPTNTSCKTKVEEDGIIYISGTKDCIDFNYVWYSGKLWRITAIYPDGTMKMITDGLITSIAYGEDNKFYTDENTTSYMYQWLNQEFLPTLYNYENIIVEDAVWNASPGNGTISTKLPVTGQEEVLVNASVGLLNSYEYYKSYQNTSYGSGYLNIGYYWWLLNPYSASSSNVWNVGQSVNGFGIGISHGPSSTNGVRPSVNLKSTIQLVGGSGTVDNPYRIKGDRENIEENVTLINTRGSGEYVKLVDEETAPTFRIVGTETINGAISTKLVLNDYVRDTTDVDADSNTTEVLTRAFGTTNSWSSVSETDPTYWRGYSNNTWIKEVDPTYNSETGTFGMLERGTYYLGRVTSGSSYKLAVCKTANNAKSVQDCIDKNTDETSTVQTSVMEYSGLLRYGEMFASQFGTGYGNSSNMWLITSYSSSSNVWYVNNYGYGFNNGPSYTYGARPSINLKSEIVIKSGSGTKQDPFVVGLPS